MKHRIERFEKTLRDRQTDLCENGEERIRREVFSIRPGKKRFAISTVTDLLATKRGHSCKGGKRVRTDDASRNAIDFHLRISRLKR